MTADHGGDRPGRRVVSPIEVESYRRLRELVDLGHLPPLARAVTERIVYATADVDYADDLVVDEAALAGGLAALRGGAPVVTDARMVAAGITSGSGSGPVPLAAGGEGPGHRGSPAIRCGLDAPGVAAAAAEGGLTRSAAGILLAAAACGPGAVYVVGNAPTALRALLRADARPALVVGLVVGFVDAAESKAALRASGLPALTNRGPKGGSAAAAAAVNALLYSELRDPSARPVSERPVSERPGEHAEWSTTVDQS